MKWLAKSVGAGLVLGAVVCIANEMLFGFDLTSGKLWGFVVFVMFADRITDAMFGLHALD